jgi:hypothetical protein
MTKLSARAIKLIESHTFFGDLVREAIKRR